MATLDEIRSKLQAQQSKNENRGGGGDRAMYPFWNTPNDQSSTIRFLPDGDSANTFFWVERLVIKLPFQGIKGGDDKEVIVQVPCMEMYGESCPIITETRPWWKDPDLQPMARKYYKKKSYLFQGFVVNSAFEEKELPENPIRRFAINSSIFDIIKSSLMNPEMEDMPIDFENGRDFKLTKTTKGQFANYSTSNWSFKTRPLNTAERGAIEQHGLFNLKEYLPKKPDSAELNAIKEMFQASVNQEAYDSDRWGNFYKPFGLNTGSSSGDRDDEGFARNTPASSSSGASAGASDIMARLNAGKTASAPVQEEAPAASTPAAGGKPDAQEILRRIRERQGS
jgi:gp32 DNA binding protein like